MYKALLVALIGLFFSSFTHAANVLKMPCTPSVGNGVCPSSYFYGTTGSRSEILSLLNESGDSSYSNTSGVSKTGAYCFVSSGAYICVTYSTSHGAQWVPDTQACSENPDLSFCEETVNFCPDGSIAPNGDTTACPVYTCSDGTTTQDPETCPTFVECSDGSTAPTLDQCPPPVLCPNGAAAPGNDVANCPINCDILNGPVDPSCDSEEEPPEGICDENETPVFDNCVYGPDDPRNELDEDDHCQQFPDALSCNPPDFPDLDDPTKPPPPGGTGTGTDTGTPTPPPPPVTDSITNGSSTNLTKQDHKDTNKGVESRIDNLRYDIAKLHSGLNYQTGILARGLTGVGQQLQANGAKTDRSNDLLSGVNKNLDALNAGLKGDPLISGNFDVEGGINNALGITGNEKISDLVQDPVKLSDYTEQYDQFLSDQNLSCSNVLPTIEFSVNGKQYSFDINYQPACDWLSNLGNFLLFVTWIAVPAIVFGRRS